FEGLRSSRRTRDGRSFFRFCAVLCDAVPVGGLTSMDRFKLLVSSIVLAAFVGVFAGAPPTSAQMPKSKGSEGKGFPGQKGAPGGGAAMQLPVIDTHVHLDAHVGRDRTDYEGAARVALDLMDQTGVRVALLMSPPLPPDRKGRYDDPAII